MPTLLAAALCFAVTLGCGGEAKESPDSGTPPDGQSQDAQPPDGAATDSQVAADGAGNQDAGDQDAGMPTTDPGDPGPEPHSTWTAQVPVGSGSEATTLTVTIHGPDSAGPHPILVFTHGFQLGPSDYQSYGQHLASWGYVVAMPQMPGSLFSPTTHRVLKIYLLDLIDWVEAEGTLADGPLRGKADPSRLALAGHSMGGKISFLAATEDARAKGIFGVDPVDSGGGPLGGSAEDYPSVTPELMHLVTVPLVSLGETVNSTAGGLGQACAPADQNFQQYYAHATSPALEVDVVGASHMSFLDDPNCGMVCSACPAGTDDPSVTRRITRRTLTAFLELVLRNHLEHRHWLTGPGMQVDVTAGLVLTQHKNGF